jgi:hypothetical protein
MALEKPADVLAARPCGDEPVPTIAGASFDFRALDLDSLQMPSIVQLAALQALDLRAIQGTANPHQELHGPLPDTALQTLG